MKKGKVQGQEEWKGWHAADNAGCGVREHRLIITPRDAAG